MAGRVTEGNAHVTGRKRKGRCQVMGRQSGRGRLPNPQLEIILASLFDVRPSADRALAFDVPRRRLKR